MIAMLVTAMALPESLHAHEAAPGAGKENAFAVFADLRQLRRDKSPLAFAAPGFMTGGDIGPDTAGLSLAHAGAQVSLHSANNGIYGVLEASAHGHHGGTAALTIEQAWIARDNGNVTLTLGRQFAPLGLRNAVHGVSAAFPDPALAYRIFLGDHYLDDGALLQWHADDAVTIGLGSWRGSFPAGGINSDGNAAFTAHIDGKFTLENALAMKARLAVLAAQADLRYDERFDPGHSHNPFVAAPTLTYFSGDSTLAIASLQWLAPDDGLEILGEYFLRDESGDVRNLTQQAVYDGTQSGMMAEALWSPAMLSATRAWSFGLRYTVLHADNTLTGPGAATLAAQSGLAAGGNPSETSAVIAWRMDERQVLRLQACKTGDVAGGDSVILQYAMNWSVPLAR